MVKKLFSLIYLMAVMVNAMGNEENMWQSFKVKFGKIYDNAIVEQKRFSIFHENLQKIESHNEKYYQGLTSYKMGVNQFTDLTNGEFVELTGLRGTRRNYTKNVNFEAPINGVPDAINWVDLGAVTDVKDQGACGSCWSFSATGSIEGQNYIKNNQLISLSVQNLVDCSGAYGDNGCAGGMMDFAFQYVCDHGIMSAADYPYIGSDGTCHFDETKVAVKVTSFVDIQPGSESDLKAAVGTVGPVSVAVDASGFQMYDEGILDDNSCGNDENSLDHGVLVVGYGTENGIDYWLVKNSWTKYFGENGYIRMSRNKDNQCGIATWASYPVL